MKNLISLSTLLFVCLASYGQEKLETLKTPSSPAANILDLQPAAILTPKSAGALETAIFSNFIGDNGNVSVPNDFALEFSPFWIFDHKPIEIQDYLFPEGIFTPLARNSSISLASTQNFTLGNNTESNAISLGYRTSIFVSNQEDRQTITQSVNNIRSSQALSKVTTDLSAEIVNNRITSQNEALVFMKKALTTAFKSNNLVENDKVDEMVQKVIALLPEFNPLDTDSYEDAVDNAIDTVTERELVFTTFKQALKERKGLFLDFALASLINFPTNDFNKAYIPKASFWFTPRYKIKSSIESLNILGVFRYEWHDLSYYRTFFPGVEIFENNIDYGISIDAEFKKFSLKFELVGRSSQTETPAGLSPQGQQLFAKDTNSDIQYMGVATYKLTDGIVLSYNLGKKFDPLLNPTNTLVSLLGLNFGFGAATEKDLK